MIDHRLEPLTLDAEPTLEPCDLRGLPAEHSSLFRDLDRIERHPVMVRAIEQHVQRLREHDESLTLLCNAIAAFTLPPEKDVVGHVE